MKVFLKDGTDSTGCHTAYALRGRGPVSNEYLSCRHTAGRQRVACISKQIQSVLHGDACDSVSPVDMACGHVKARSSKGFKTFSECIPVNLEADKVYVALDVIRVANDEREYSRCADFKLRASVDLTHAHDERLPAVGLLECPASYDKARMRECISSIQSGNLEGCAGVLR